MSDYKSLADKMVFFMRVRDDARAKIDALPRNGDAWPVLSVMLDEQEKHAADALYSAAVAADRLGRLAALAELAQPKKQKA